MTRLSSLVSLSLLVGIPAFAHTSHVSLGNLAATVFHEDPVAELETILPAGPKSHAQDIDWSQPPIGCVEEMVPGTPPLPCLDLTRVSDPLDDWPDGISSTDKQYWVSHRRYLTYCRSSELLRREALHPGSQQPVPLEVSWMMVDAVTHFNEAVPAIYEANRMYGVPLEILTGAMYQESMFATLGIADDGGNFSCGVGQTSIIGWCNWVNTRSNAEKAALGWPLKHVDCTDDSIVNLGFLRPIYEIALTKLNGLPDYRLSKKEFEGIPLSAFVGQWPQAMPEMQNLRFQLIQSFYEHCSEPRPSILAAAREIAGNYAPISSAFQQKDRYAPGQHFNRVCQAQDSGNTYPLHTGWLLAVGIYNAGPRVIDVTAYYNGWSWQDYHDPAKIASFTPDQIVESLYWGGKYDTVTDLIDFTNFSSESDAWLWYKACVVQRHVARVMQNVTLVPDFFVYSLEGNYPCAKSIFDGNHLVQSSVPPFRQTSSGVKPH